MDTHYSDKIVRVQLSSWAMDYHHSKYAGNPGDVWKHFCLLEVCRALFFLGNKKNSYFESHCGSGKFDLLEEGEWKNGIGLLKEIPSELSETIYFQTAFQQLAKKEYLGSWRWVTTLGVFSNYFLCDKNPDVIDNAKEESKKVSESGFHFLAGDGFERLKNLETMSFVMIDPPYTDDSDWENIESLLPKLKQNQPHYLIWYPLFQEDKRIQIFSNLEREEIVWNKKEKMMGSGITGSPSCMQILKDLPELQYLRAWLTKNN